MRTRYSSDRFHFRPEVEVLENRYAPATVVPVAVDPSAAGGGAFNNPLLTGVPSPSAIPLEGSALGVGSLTPPTATGSLSLEEILSPVDQATAATGASVATTLPAFATGASISAAVGQTAFLGTTAAVLGQVSDPTVVGFNGALSAIGAGGTAAALPLTIANLFAADNVSPAADPTNLLSPARSATVFPTLPGGYLAYLSTFPQFSSPFSSAMQDPYGSFNLNNTPLRPLTIKFYG